jgi:hypothetical protein
MNNKTFLKTLEFMKGKTFQYANQIHYLVDYSIDEQREKVTIRTNLKQFERGYDSAEEFLSYWKPANTMAIQKTSESNESAIMLEQENSLADEMITILKENIQKVKTDKNYIPQAQAINNNINSIINVKKLQLDVYKQFKPKKSA